MMKILLTFLLMIIILGSTVIAQTPGFHMIFGNCDGSTTDVYLDDLIELEVWVATPEYFDLNGDSVQDTINLVFIPLGTNDSVISSREGGIAYFPFINWDYQFTNPAPHGDSGFTNQSFLAGPPLDGWWSPLNTSGDTINVLSFYMYTTDDSSLINQTVCPFIEGYDPVNGGLLWGIQDGSTPIIPAQSFSCLYFVEYLAGDANRSGFVNGVDVAYLVAYIKGYGPQPYPILAGDANGDCVTNAMDVSYIIDYCIGGPEPFLGNCH